MSTAHNTKNSSSELGVLESLRLGISVWLSEMTWLGSSLYKQFMISRLVKRLQEEYTNLGKAVENEEAQSSEKEICLKQISFLKDEIHTLENELEAQRIQRVNMLRNRQGTAPIDEQFDEQSADKKMEE